MRSFLLLSSGVAAGLGAGVQQPATLSLNADCVSPDPRGYLLYLTFAQQFNNQLISVVENIRLAKALGRVLVLTGFMEHAREPGGAASDGHDYYDGDHVLKPFTSYFDAHATLANFGLSEWQADGVGDYMTLDKFNKLGLCGANDIGNISPMRAEAHALVSHWEPQPAGGKLERSIDRGWVVPEHIYKCPQEGPDCGVSGFDTVETGGSNDRGNPLYDLQMTFSDVKLIVHAADDLIQLGSFPSGRETPMLVSDNLFYAYNNTYPSYMPDGEPGLIRGLSNFRWTAEVSVLADAFVQQQFGGEMYDAMHWRRGYTDGSISIRSLDEVAQKIRDQSDQHNIFLATNKLTADDVSQLQALTGRRIVSMALSGEAQSLDPNQVSHVEQLICTRSKRFIATPGSTWSYNVMAFRGHMACAEGCLSLIATSSNSVHPSKAHALNARPNATEDTVVARAIK